MRPALRTSTTRCAQQAEGVRDGALGLAAGRGDVADAHLALEQRHEQPQPPRVGEEPEDLRQLPDVPLVGHGLPDRRHTVGVDGPGRAAGEVLRPWFLDEM